MPLCLTWWERCSASWMLCMRWVLKDLLVMPAWLKFSAWCERLTFSCLLCLWWYQNLVGEIKFIRIDQIQAMMVMARNYHKELEVWVRAVSKNSRRGSSWRFRKLWMHFLREWNIKSFPLLNGCLWSLLLCLVTQPWRVKDSRFFVTFYEGPGILAHLSWLKS